MLRGGGRVAWQLVGMAVALWVAGQVFAGLQPVLVSIFVALVISAIVSPFAARMEAAGVHVGIAAGLGVVLVVGAMAASLTFVGVRLVAELPALVDDLEAQRQPILDWFANGPLALSEGEVMDLLDRGIAEAEAAAGDGNGEANVADAAADEELEDDGVGPRPALTVAVLKAAFTTTRMLGFALVGVVLAFFLVRDRRAIADAIVRFSAGGSHDGRANAALAKGWRALIGYVRGSVFIGTVDALLIGAALFILDVPLAGVLTVLTFLAGFVPVVGATVTGLFAVVVVGVSIGVGPGIGMLVWIIVVQQLDGNVLQPMVMRSETNLHPIATILSLTVGGLLGGVLGALLAVPVAAVVTNVVAELLTPTPPDPIVV